MAFNADNVMSNFRPPFSRNLRVDAELNLSHGDFKQRIETFYPNEQLFPIDQLKATPSYPTPHVLARFANMAYRDCNEGDPETPVGWQLLTTASNVRNGYFGAAYWHPEHQQVVIAHRGTDTNDVISFLKDLYTDIRGILRNKYVGQMNSASTFANKVVAVLQEIEQGKKVSFEVFFTGHSLGGWLAQITTFTTEYLEVEGGTFLKKLKREEHEPLASSTVQDSHDIRQSYHPHTVAFDSPGCETILLQMKSTFDLRYRSSIALQHLDITSYLSVPNRINTCNSHLGTVYRIFTDLSDMGFLGRNTLCYNVTTHSMDKIVEGLDPAKDEPEIEEVVDWPVTEGFTGGVEWNNFFMWAESRNNYHPDLMETVSTEVPKSYHWLRYQTTAYDKCTKSLNFFTQDEREFLKLYRSLRDLKELFKPEDLFWVMSNAEAKKEAQEKLQNFEIYNKRIRCPNPSILHGLITYVKRLVRLFPQLKEGVKDQFSSPQIRNTFYLYETRRYVERIRQSALDFNPGVLGLRQFLTSDKTIWQLQMMTGDAWTGITKVYRVLRKTSCTPNYFSEGHYTILKLKQLLSVHRGINLNTLLESMETPHLLMIACGNNQPVNNELKNMIRELFTTSLLNGRETMKIILTTQSESDISVFIKQIASLTHHKEFIATDEQLMWSHLTANSQGKILEKTVIFQGRRVALNQLTSAESMTDSFPLADLLQEKDITIGEEPEPPASSGYSEKYYIDRTFNHNIVIRQDILNDERAGKFADLLASTEHEFKQLCQQNPIRNVHWLVKEKAGELVWQQSQGNIRKLHEYIDVQNSASSDLDNLLQQEKKQTVMLIADIAGMGKTTVLTHMSKRIKEKNPAHWLVRIDLNEYGELFKAQTGKKVDEGWVLEFVSQKVLKLESDLEKDFFKRSFGGNDISKVVVIVDGFDEICPNYKETVIDMLHILKQASLEQLWITTRPHLRQELEDNLQQLSYTLQPFSEVEQVEFLKKFWLQTLKSKETNQHRLQIYAKTLIRKLAQSISDKNKVLTGIPLQTHMLAKAFEEDFNSFYKSEESEPELPYKLDLLGLYRRFVSSRYDIFYSEKSKTPAGNVAALETQERDLKGMQVEHWRLALEELFTEDEVALLPIHPFPILPDEHLARIGIVQKNNDSKLQFFHRTIAEYFVAEYLINQLTKKTEQHVQVQEILLNKVLFKKEFLLVRNFLDGLLEEPKPPNEALEDYEEKIDDQWPEREENRPLKSVTFLDGLLEKSKPSNEALKYYGEKLDGQWKEREENRPLEGVTKVLHTAAKEDNAHIIGFLLDSLKSGGHSSTVTEMLLATDRQGQTAWHKAAENESIKALQKIWERAATVTTGPEGDEKGHPEASDTTRASVEEKELQPNQIKNKLFVAKDKYGNTAWHGAAQRGSLKALETLWIWAKEAGLNINELLLVQNEGGNTAWQLAAQTGHLKLLQKLGVWAKEAQVNRNDLKDKLLQATDQDGYTVWHRAAEGGNLEALETLWILGKESELKPDEIFLTQGKDGNTAWQVAAQRGYFKVLKKLWEWANGEEMDGRNVLKDKLLARNKYGNIAWNPTAERGSLKALEKSRICAKEVEQNQDELKKSLFLTQNKQEETFWYLAAERDHFEVLEKLWVWAKEAQKNPDDVKKALLLAKDQYGYTVWHRAAQRGSLEELETLWSWASEAVDEPD